MWQWSLEATPPPQSSTGADRGWITLAVHWQATVFTALPVIFGIPVGIVVGRLVFVAFADSMGAVHDAASRTGLADESRPCYFRVSSTRSAACHPHMPWTPAPGGVDAEHKNSVGFGVTYGRAAIVGRKINCSPLCAPPAMSPPT
jgi:hypothetical protein